MVKPCPIESKSSQNLSYLLQMLPTLFQSKIYILSYLRNIHKNNTLPPWVLSNNKFSDLWEITFLKIKVIRKSWYLTLFFFEWNCHWLEAAFYLVIVWFLQCSSVWYLPQIPQFRGEVHMHNSTVHLKPQKKRFSYLHRFKRAQPII